MSEPAMALRVLHVAEILAGGTASYLSEIVRAQVRDARIASVQLLLPEFHRDALPLPEGCEAVYFGGGASRLRRSWALARALHGLLRARPDVVLHLHGTFAGFAGRLVALLTGHAARTVYCSHGWAFDRVSSRWVNATIAAVERALALLTPRIVCISAHDQAIASAAGIARQRLQLLHNGVQDLMPVPPQDRPQWPADGRLRCLFVGRLDRQKGVEVFLQAMQGQAALHGMVVGGSVVSEELQSQLSVPDNVQMLGWMDRTDVRRWMAACDVLVVPSRWEGFGLVAAEGMREGKPIVASAVGGLRELVVHGLTGYQVPPDDPQALRAALLRLAQGDHRAMGAAGRARFLHRFEAGRMNEEIIRLYRELLAGIPLTGYQSITIQPFSDGARAGRRLGRVRP